MDLPSEGNVRSRAHLLCHSSSYVTDSSLQLVRKLVLCPYGCSRGGGQWGWGAVWIQGMMGGNSSNGIVASVIPCTYIN